MNKRIQELAMQAGYMEDGFGIGHWDMPECKKFAEMIVRECAKLCDERAASAPIGSDEQCEAEDCAQTIMKHFGVKL